MTNGTNDHRTEEELFCEKCGKTVDEETAVQVETGDLEVWIVCEDCADIIVKERDKQ
jgi:DNA-directed RNA polymerase subunit RPC12/RpoP